MAPRSALANISYTVDSDSEDEMARDTFPTPDSNTENKAPARKTRGKATQPTKAAKAAKPAAKAKTAARRTSAGSVSGVKRPKTTVAKKPGAKGGRKALAERANAGASDTEEVDEFDEVDEVAPIAPVKPAQRGRPARAKKAQEEEKIEETAAPTKRMRKVVDAAAPAPKPAPKAKTGPKAKATKRAKEPEPEPEPEQYPTILETQQDPEPDPMDMDVEESIEVEDIPETMPPPPRPTGRRTQQQPKAARQTSTGPRRAGSVSDTERDPVLRRKVGDLTKKLEAMTTKYDSLKEIATSDKGSNFEQLKKQTEQVTKNQDAVIKSLKQQITEMQSRSSELTSMKKELAKLQKENARLASEKEALSKSLESSQKETKTLSTKLAAARSSAPPEIKVPGSAVKARGPGVVLPGTAEAAKEAQLRQSKIDLYSDLTNLVIVGVKKGEGGEDVYDCLQTGRNGTLHFQLTILNDEDSYEDAQFVYTPQLDEKRDSELLDLLPEYLTEDIEFPRHQVARFYEKILESMTKKIELVD